MSDVKNNKQIRPAEYYSRATLQVRDCLKRIIHPLLYLSVGDISYTFVGGEWIKNPDYDNQVRLIVQMRLPDVNLEQLPALIALLPEKEILMNLDKDEIFRQIRAVISNVAQRLFVEQYKYEEINNNSNKIIQ